MKFGRPEIPEIKAIAGIIVDGLLAVALKGENGIALRTACGLLQDVSEQLAANTLAASMLAAFDAAQAAGADLVVFENLSARLGASTGYRTDAANQTRFMAIVFCFIEEAKVVGQMKFASRDQATAMLLRMADIVDDIKLTISNELSANDYKNVNALSGNLMRHLAETERKLPQVVQYTFGSSLPSLTLAQRIYADGTRSDELAKENLVVHPAFMPIEIKALSI